VIPVGQPALLVRFESGPQTALAMAANILSHSQVSPEAGNPTVEIPPASFHSIFHTQVRGEEIKI